MFLLEVNPKKKEERWFQTKDCIGPFLIWSNSGTKPVHFKIFNAKNKSLPEQNSLTVHNEHIFRHILLPAQEGGYVFLVLYTYPFLFFSPPEFSLKKGCPHGKTLKIESLQSRWYDYAYVCSKKMHLGSMYCYEN